MRHVLTSETEMLKCMCFFYYRKFLEIPILEEDSYEKNVVMYVVIGEPRHIAGNFHYIFTRVMDSITRSHRMTGDNRWSRSNIFVTSESVEKNRGLLRIEDFFSWMILKIESRILIGSIFEYGISVTRIWKTNYHHNAEICLLQFCSVNWQHFYKK